MLFGLKRILALGPELVMLDVAGLVLAVRHFGERQVRDRRQDLVQLLLGCFRLAFQSGQRHLPLIALGPQLRPRGFGLLRLRRADFLRRRVPSRLGLLRLQDRRATLLVDAEQIRRRNQPPGFVGERAAVQRLVEPGRVFTNPSDVVHRRLSFAMFGVRGNPSRSYKCSTALSQRFAGPVWLRLWARRIPFFRFPVGGWSAGRRFGRLRDARDGTAAPPRATAGPLLPGVAAFGRAGPMT